MISKVNNKQKRTARILAADDDPIMREMMKARLGDGFDVIVAENGEIAWNMLAKEKFDLAIIDLAMPKLDGFGLISHLRQTPKTVDMPIIVATSRGDESAIEQAFSAGASSFVTKPINWSLFQYQVRFVLKNGLAEQKLRRKLAILEKASHIKDKMLAAVGKNLSKPAENLSGLVHDIIHKDSADTSLFEHGTPDELEQSITSLKNIVENVLPLADLYASSFKLTESWQDVNSLIGECTQYHQKLASSRSVRILGRQMMDSPHILIDKTVWQQSLSVIMEQALRASPAGGTIEIIAALQRDGSFVFSLRDNGDITSIDSKTHSGLGLDLVNRAMFLHQGRFIQQPAPDHGRISALWLPAARIEKKPEKQFSYQRQSDRA